MITLGLTGSIGMGKSTTASLFAQAGVPVYDADAAVHAVYARGGAAVTPVEEAFAGVVVDGVVDRAFLSARVLNNPEALKRLEAIVHPLLGAHRAGVYRAALESGARLIVLDVPLLFETGGDKAMDAIAVVSAPPEMQRARVLERPGMTEAKLDAILARQLSDPEKRARADFVIDTGRGIAAARAQVADVLAALANPAWTSRRTRA